MIDLLMRLIYQYPDIVNYFVQFLGVTIGIIVYRIYIYDATLFNLVRTYLNLKLISISVITTVTFNIVMSLSPVIESSVEKIGIVISSIGVGLLGESISSIVVSKTIQLTLIQNLAKLNPFKGIKIVFEDKQDKDDDPPK